MESLREIIKSDFQSRQKRHPSFSLRAYARYLGVSSTSLSMYLNGRRSLSNDSRKKILLKLGFSPELLKEERRADFNYEEIDIDKINIVADWYYFGILSLMETKGYVHKSEWISKRLGITKATAEKALLSLEEAGLLANGKPSQQHFKTPSRFYSYAIRKSHLHALDLARHSLESDPVSKRSFTATTLATSPEKLAEAEKRIEKFRRRLSAFLETGEKTQVYRLSVQLFPLSKESA